MSETPLCMWKILEETGHVCCSCCNCKASLGEVCTHTVAAVLFYLVHTDNFEETGKTNLHLCFCQGQEKDPQLVVTTVTVIGFT